MNKTLFDEPKIDCHVHVLDPVGFPYGADTHYRPAGQETNTAGQLLQLMETYGTRHALVVGPNSGYALDNRCLLDAIAKSDGRCKGIAVVANDIGVAELEALKAAGIVGVAWNVTHYGLDYYADAAPLLDRLAALDMFVDVQVEHDLLIPMLPLLLDSGARILVDHCGRPTPSAGLDQPGFRALLELAQTRRAFVKLSGYVKFSTAPLPYADARPFVDALIEAFTPEGCMWASDWPYLRSPVHVDYAMLLQVVHDLFPDPAHRRKVLWDTPKALFQFGS